MGRRKIEIKTLRKTYRSSNSKVAALELVGKWESGCHLNDQIHSLASFILGGKVGEWTVHKER